MNELTQLCNKMIMQLHGTMQSKIELFKLLKEMDEMGDIEILNIFYERLKQRVTNEGK